MLNIGVIVFKKVEEMDFIGPFEILSYANKIKENSVKIFLVAESKGPVRAFNGLTFLPDYDFATCPQLDIVIVPGGKGRFIAMHDDIMKSFLIQQSKNAKYITSVCTGAFILAEAGLLAGKKATTYHTALPELAHYANIEVQQKKIVHDGTVITAAGVTSGIELGFYLLKLLFDSDTAKQAAEAVEYIVDLDSL